jgi:hypothetical protein
MNRNYLTQVNPDLQSLGDEADLLYYASKDVKVSSVEFNNRVGRYIRSLTTLSFGGNSDIQIPNFDFLGSTYLQVEMPALTDKIALPQGWLYHAIESVNYSWGTSNISLVKISGQDLIQHNYLSCETREKREKMLNLGGLMKPTGVPQDATKAQILLKFPWSVMSCDERKKLFDTRLLNTNLLIQITWAPKERFMGWLNADIADVPTAFSSAEIILKQNELTNHADSLYSEMRKDSSLIYNFPFCHLQTGTTHRFDSVHGVADVRFELNSFLNSDLIGILFSVVKNKDLQRTSDISHSFINPFDLKHVTDIKLEFNGQILSHYPGNLAELATLNISKGDTTCNLHKVVPSTGLEDNSTELSYVWYLPFTQYKTLIFSDEYNNTSVYKSQPLDLSFKYEDVIDNDLMVVRTTYLYNAYASIQDMSSRIHFG